VPHDLDMNTPGHTFQLAEHNILLYLLVLVRAKNVLLILYVGKHALIHNHQ
jgi:hypothetical protein